MGPWGACAQKRRFDVHRYFSLTCCSHCSYDALRGSAVPIGEIGGGRERPPFLPPGSAQRGRLMCTAVPSPGGSLPSHNPLAGRPQMTPVAGKMGRMSAPDIHEQWLETLRKQAVERLRARRAYRCPRCGEAYAAASRPLS